jgi:hypothetical protein
LFTCRHEGFLNLKVAGVLVGIGEVFLVSGLECLGWRFWKGCDWKRRASRFGLRCKRLGMPGM